MEKNLSAVIDLGTNTFHLLVAEVSSGKLKEVYRERIFVKLASDGIDRIGPAPFERGTTALKHFRKILEEYKCLHFIGIGTAALRRAANGADFIRAAGEIGIPIRLIDGRTEAGLITKGVLAAVPPEADPLLIMDIGGGSTEYILVADGSVVFQESFPIGISVLRTAFHKSEPIAVSEQQAMRQFLSETTRPLADALKATPVDHLVGAAGTFDLLAELLRDESAPFHPTSHRLALGGWPVIRDRIVSASAEERSRIPGLPPERVDMVVSALLLLDFTISLTGISRVTVSNYALKEGALLEGIT